MFPGCLEAFRSTFPPGTPIVTVVLPQSLQIGRSFNALLTVAFLIAIFSNNADVGKAGAGKSRENTGNKKTPCLVGNPCG